MNKSEKNNNTQSLNKCRWEASLCHDSLKTTYRSSVDIICLLKASDQENTSWEIHLRTLLNVCVFKLIGFEVQYFQ